MSNSIIYPSDIVDSAGTVWPTVGENIRHGAKAFNYFGLDWKKATVMISSGVVTQSGITDLHLVGANSDVLTTTIPIAITNLYSAITKPDATLVGTSMPRVFIGTNGGCCIYLYSTKYNSILLEFMYRVI